MASIPESALYKHSLDAASAVADARPRGWFRMGVLAMASALAGGVAAAWYYRNTLARLRQAESLPPSVSSIQDEDEF
jgi:hypothetical protein